MNAIAEKHGACWTHFWAAHHRFAAEWAATQSSTGQWDHVLEALDESIRIGSIRHEYAPHLHCDYEPESKLPPQPRLCYDPATDGILPNEYYDPISNPTHRYHDWDGAARGGPGIKALGTWDDIDTKTGSLFKALHYLSMLQAQNRATFCCHTGSYDFGGTPHDEATSTSAYEALSLLANADAKISVGAAQRRGHLYWCRKENRSTQVDSLAETHLIQLGVTQEVGFYAVEHVNAWFADQVKICRGPGVHAVVLTTHAMFMRGVPDPFRSLDGG